MLEYVTRRFLYMVATLVIISIVSFVVIQLPPGDFLTSYLAKLAEAGDTVSLAERDALRARYGLDRPMHIRYLHWISGVLRGDFGWSLEWMQSVSDLIWSRLGLTVLMSVCAMLFTWIIAFPIGILSAVKQYSFWDYTATFFGFIGLAIPNFLLALVLMWISFEYFGANVGGLFSPEYADAPWSLEKVLDLAKHLWIPMIVIGTAGTASLIRVMRANLLDELRKPYVVTARAKGVSETRLLLKYPVRLALNPFISTIGWMLPAVISGETITSVVLNLPTSGALFLGALRSQDMYLAGSFILLSSSLTVIGTFLSDLALAWVDPRIRFN
jgi:peptide/nickel transport system permease protein